MWAHFVVASLWSILNLKIHELKVIFRLFSLIIHYRIYYLAKNIYFDCSSVGSWRVVIHNISRFHYLCHTCCLCVVSSWRHITLECHFLFGWRHFLYVIVPGVILYDEHGILVYCLQAVTERVDEGRRHAVVVLIIAFIYTREQELWLVASMRVALIETSFNKYICLELLSLSLRPE